MATVPAPQPTCDSLREKYLAVEAEEKEKKKARQDIFDTAFAMGLPWTKGVWPSPEPSDDLWKAYQAYNVAIAKLGYLLNYYWAVAKKMNCSWTQGTAKPG